MKLTGLLCFAFYAVPFVNLSLVPVSVTPGSPAFTLTVTGTGFASTAVVKWNRSPRLTEVISSTELKATINAFDVAKAGTAWVTVTNPAPGGGTSDVVFFPIRPTFSAVAMAGRQAFSNVSGAVAGWFPQCFAWKWKWYLQSAHRKQGVVLPSTPDSGRF